METSGVHKTRYSLVAAALLLMFGCASPRDQAAKDLDGGPTVRLVARTFVTAPGIGKELADWLGTQDAQGLHVIVQFVRAPATSDRASLEKRYGIRFLDPVPDHAYFARVPRAALVDKQLFGTAAATETPVHAVVRIRPTDKVAPWLLAGQVLPYARRGEGHFAVIVQFFGDIDVEAQLALLQGMGIEVEERLPLVNGVQIEIPADQLLKLASHDSVKWVEEIPGPAEEDNDGIRAAGGVNSDAVNLATDYNLSGAGVTVGHWEPGIADNTHGDFTGRITSVDTMPVSGHATHVAGTAIGSGAQSAANGGGANQWRGIAFGASLRSYTTAGFQAKYTNATNNAVTISTNSWGTSHCHQVVPPNDCYDNNSQFYDGVVSGRLSDGTASGLARRVLIFGSSGNRGRPERHADDITANGQYDPGEAIYLDQDDSGTVTAADSFTGVGTAQGAGTVLIDFQLNERHDETVNAGGLYELGEVIYRDADGSSTVTVGDRRLIAGGGFGAGTVVAGGDGDVNNFLRQFRLWGNTRIPNSAKNTIVVGNYINDTGVLWRSSSRGPTTDGRLKPDIVAPGSQNGGDGGVTSTDPGNDYRVRIGTSMATPAAAGAAGLLTEWYRTACQAGDPKPSTLRAILLHSAVDVTQIPNIAGVFAGPDYAYGYGMVNVPAAAGVVPHHVEGSIAVVGAPDSYQVTIGQVQNLKVTLAWDDPPWNNAAAPSPVTGLLQTDLDLEVVAPDGTIYTPWQLNPANPFQPAVPSPGFAMAAAIPAAARDRLNTAEQVIVPNAGPGTWTIRVLGSTLNLGPQDYSLVGDLIEPQLSPCGAAPATDVWLRDNAADTGTTPSAGLMWLSPDVWNRVDADGGTAHQNPEFGEENALYVQLRNRSPGELAEATSIDVWIAQASTGLAWPDDFEYVGRLPAPNLAAGLDRVIGPLIWNPPSPNPSNHFCFYVRVVNPQDPITIAEGASVGSNASQSNNIAWRNVNIVDLRSTTEVTFLTRNLRHDDAEVDIVIELPDGLLAVAEVKLSLAAALQRQWVAAGALGTGFETEPAPALPVEPPGEYLYDQRGLRRLAAEPKLPARQVIKLTSSKVQLEKIRYRGSQAEAVTLAFSSASTRREVFPVDVFQRVNGEIVGGIRYLVRTGPGG